jgi:hypothetical protein
VRALIRAITSEELSVQREGDKSDGRSDSDAKDIDLLDREIRRAQIKLGAALGSQAVSGIGPLDMVAIEQLIRELFPGLSPLEAIAVREKKRKASAVREKAQERLSSLRSDLKVVENQVGNNEVLLGTYEGQLARDKRGVVLAENAPCPICEVPLNAVLENGCPRSAETGYLEEVRERRKETAEKVKEYSTALASKKDERKALVASVSAAEARLSECRAAEASAEEEQYRVFTASRDGDNLFDNAKQLEALITERANAITQEAQGKQLHDERESQIRLIRQKNDGAVQHLSQEFDAVIRELVPGEIEGAVIIDGKGITLKVSQGGERSTAAIESLKVVAFDIAALILAVEGTASLPTFLLHDSPREADLGQSIYDRLFQFMKRLEGEAHFQYIVTTTTEPPKELSLEPWLRATLRGGPPQDRLMACDL